MPGLVTFDEDEIERIHRVKLRRIGVSPDEMSEMDYFDELDLLEINRVESHFEQKELAKMIANELAKILVKVMRR